MDFCGHPIGVLENDKLRLEYLTDVGPRIARLIPTGGKNLLAEVPDLHQETRHGRYHFMGGHRLWQAPENLERTYIPDQPVKCDVTPDGVRILTAMEPGTGIVKEIQIQLAHEFAGVTVDHILRNEGAEEMELAPWALTMFRQGGKAIIPQPEPLDSFLPNRLFSFWPYTRLNDDRLHLGDDYVVVDAKPALPPMKIGSYIDKGWVAYWLEGTLVVKQFSSGVGQSFPDGGCNVEVYCNDRFIELESLGPLIQLDPGESVSHHETWELHPGLDTPLIPTSLRTRLGN